MVFLIAVAFSWLPEIFEGGITEIVKKYITHNYGFVKRGKWIREERRICDDIPQL